LTAIVRQNPRMLVRPHPLEAACLKCVQPAKLPRKESRPCAD